MSNLTINVDDQLIKLARVRAIQQGTSLSAKVREFLSLYAAGTSQRTCGDATVDLLRMIDDVRNEAMAQGKAASHAPAPSDRRRMLRDALHKGDYRARDRIEGAGSPTHKSS